MNSINIIAFEFVKQAIDNLVIQYPGIQCTYQLDECENEHLIEILPSKNYEEDDNLMIRRSEITTEFHKLFPYEAIYFITNTALFPVTEPIYVKAGISYNKSRYEPAIDNGFLIHGMLGSYFTKAEVTTEYNVVSPYYLLNNSEIYPLSNSMNIKIDINSLPHSNIDDTIIRYNWLLELVTSKYSKMKAFSDPSTPELIIAEGEPNYSIAA